MILQALVKLYEDLAAQGKIARPGWSPVQVSWALCLDAGGRLIQVIPLLERQKNGGEHRTEHGASHSGGTVGQH